MSLSSLPGTGRPRPKTRPRSRCRRTRTRLIEAVSAANKNASRRAGDGRPGADAVARQASARCCRPGIQGQRGGQAIARLLFGEVNPSGRLSMTFPRTAEQAPRASAPRASPNRPPSTTPAALVRRPGPIKGFPVSYVEGAAVGYRWYAQQKLRAALSVRLWPFLHDALTTSQPQGRGRRRAQGQFRRDQYRQGRRRRYARNCTSRLGASVKSDAAPGRLPARWTSRPVRPGGSRWTVEPRHPGRL